MNWLRRQRTFLEYTDDLYGVFEGIPDYEETMIQAGWIEADKDKKDKHNFYDGDGGYSDAETWENLFDEVATAQDIELIYPGVYEHWIVSDCLADKLEAHGEKVLRDFFGMTIWCRTTTEQAILLDGVISKICAEMEILEGQKYD